MPTPYGRAAEPHLRDAVQRGRGGSDGEGAEGTPDAERTREPLWRTQRAACATMRSRLSLNPGQRGTKKLLARYGDRLRCVRFRYGEQHRKRFKMAEPAVEETDCEPRAHHRPNGTAAGSQETRYR